jgi:Fic family protein
MRLEDFHADSPGQVIRAPGGYLVYIPAPLPPSLNWSTRLITALGEAERNLGKLANISGTLPAPYILVRPFIRREAVLSSRIEGTRASINDLYIYEDVQRYVLESASDVLEVHNYVRAMDYGLQRIGTLPISLRLIREIHSVLMKDVRGNSLTPGEFRRIQNWIGPPGSTLENATIVPPPVNEMHQALHELENYLYASSDLPALVRIGLIHYQFEAIHPFLDGNGRVGRLLIMLLLVAWGLIPQPVLYLSAYFESHRSDYYAGLLAVSQQGDWEAWLIYFLQGISLQSLDVIACIEELQGLRDLYENRVKFERAANRLRQVVDVLFGRPVISIRQLATALQLPYRTAQRYIESLERMGILKEITGQDRNRLYQASEILKIMDRP